MKPVIFKGKEYESLQEFALAFSLTPQYVGWMIKNDIRFKGEYLDYKIQLDDTGRG